MTKAVAQNKYEAANREKKAKAIAGALALEAARRGASIRDTVLPIVKSFAKGEETETEGQVSRHLQHTYGVKNAPSIITWTRVAEILTEAVEGSPNGS